MIRRLALVASLALCAMPLHAATYTIEPDYTQGVFRWSHLPSRRARRSRSRFRCRA